VALTCPARNLSTEPAELYRHVTREYILTVFFTTLYINMHDVDIVYLHVSASHILKIIVVHKVDTLGKST